MTELLRVDAVGVQDVMFVRPRDPDNHTELEWLLPRCEPLFVYADANGRDWVRWALPKAVAQAIGWGEMRCACCDHQPVDNKAEFFHIDTAYDEVDWYLESVQ